MLLFEEKTVVAGEKPLGAMRGPTTNSTHICRRVQKSNLGHIVAGEACSLPEIRYEGAVIAWPFLNNLLKCHCNQVFKDEDKIDLSASLGQKKT